MAESLFEKFKKKVFPQDDVPDGLHLWREKIYYSIMIALSLLGVVAYLPSMVVSLRNQLWEVAILDTIAYGVVLFLLFTRSILYSLRVWGLLVIIYALGVMLLILLGPIGAGWIWLFAMPVFGSILHSFRGAVISVVVSLFTLVLLGIMISDHVFEGFLIQTYNIESWIIVSVNFISLSLLVSIPVSVLLRTLDLTLHKIQQEQETLRQRNMDLRKTNADLDDFIYTASHDLRSPVSNMEGLMDLLDSEWKNLDVPEKERQELEKLTGMIRISVSKFKSTIQALAEISAVQREEAAGEEWLDVKAVFEKVKLELRDRIQLYDPEIIEDFKENRVRFQEKNFAHILYILVDNAMAYRHPRRRPRILVSTYREGAFMVLTVQDNGLGMKPGFESKLFRMFRRMHDHVEGTGIGLYMLKRMVENAGGKIEVKSDSGSGSTFRIFFNSEE